MADYCNVTRKRRLPPPENDRGLFDSYEKKGKIITEVARINPLEIFFFCFIPSVVGSLSSIAIALIFHNDEISNYNWQCGRARLPSLSRIINLPLERTIWQMVVLFHIPMRFVELITGFNRYGRLRSIDCPSPRIYEFMRYSYFWIGVFELIFMAAISIIGERENIKIHVVCFYIFGLFGMGFFISNLYCHRYSLYYLKPYGEISYRLKMFFTIAYFICAPVLCTAFFAYWKACITIAYDVFAVTEYTGVLINVLYHSLAFFDIRHKVTFSLRIVRNSPESSAETFRSRERG